MAYALCFTSALDYWNEPTTNSRGPNRTPSACRRATTAYAKAAAKKPNRSDVDACLALRQPRPIHIAVADRQARIAKPGITCHLIRGNIPPEGISKISHDVYVCTPEFAFVQVATTFPFIRLIQIGFELCGSYYTNEQGERKSRPAPTTAEKLHAFASSTSYPGCDTARRAAQYIIDGSASPRETQLAMLLALPMKYGGYGLPKPQLNYQIKLTSTTNIIAKNTLICDLFWPDVRLAVEYDSDEFHTAALAISRDSQRRLALEVEGVTCVNVTNMRLSNFAAFDETALGLAKLLGKRIRRDKEAFIAKNRALREELCIATAIFDQDMYSE